MRLLYKFFLSGAALAVALFMWAAVIEPRSLSVRSVELGTGEHTVHIVVMSDLHVGGVHVPPKRVDAIVERINRMAPDFVLMPGDFINGHTPRGELPAREVEAIDSGLARLSAINAPAYATIGNHDRWHGESEVTSRLASAGVVVLENAAQTDGDLCVVGLADSDTGSPSVAAFQGCEGGTTPVVMMHSPDARRLLRSNTALAVAGHTHGGQVNLPILGRAVTSTQCGKPCAYGVIQTDPPVWVTSGIGTSILPVRFRSPPEIVVIELRY